MRKLKKKKKKYKMRMLKTESSKYLSLVVVVEKHSKVFNTNTRIRFYDWGKKEERNLQSWEWGAGRQIGEEDDDTSLLKTKKRGIYLGTITLSSLSSLGKR